MSLRIHQTTRSLPRYPLVPAGPVPTACDSEGVYPYERFVDTASRPAMAPYRMIVLENEFLRIEICPDCGGRIHSIVDKETGRNTVYRNDAIRPARILPRGAFLSGGIEVSFPISHTPEQIETIQFSSKQIGDRAYVWCGQRELRFGMQWTVEFSLGKGERFLCQRVRFINNTERSHPWMSWSNAAVPARPDTEFHFPGGKVLSHGDEITTIDWKEEGPKKVADLDRMMGYFWHEADVNAFGAFTPSLGTGLYHIADKKTAGGIKLWSYGVGKHEAWATDSGATRDPYLEIQGGAISDQSIKYELAPGETHSHVEFWIPAIKPMDIHTLSVPQVNLIDNREIPTFDWQPSLWTNAVAAFENKDPGNLKAPSPTDNNWAPSGMDQLGDALRWLSETDPDSASEWLFQLGSWSAAREDVDTALVALAASVDPRAHAFAARLCWFCKKDFQLAREHFDKLENSEIASHPQIVIERDHVLEQFGNETIAERQRWLETCASPEDEFVTERQISLYLDQKLPQKALELLQNTSFQRVHQRYFRTELWKKLRTQLPELDEQIPDSLGEDDLAQFGAYREYE